jgi:hypothetical protein
MIRVRLNRDKDLSTSTVQAQFVGMTTSIALPKQESYSSLRVVFPSLHTSSSSSDAPSPVMFDVKLTTFPPFLTVVYDDGVDMNADSNIFSELMVEKHIEGEENLFIETSFNKKCKEKKKKNILKILEKARNEYYGKKINNGCEYELVGGVMRGFDGSGTVTYWNFAVEDIEEDIVTNIIKHNEQEIKDSFASNLKNVRNSVPYMVVYMRKDV